MQCNECEGWFDVLNLGLECTFEELKERDFVCFRCNRLKDLLKRVEELEKGHKMVEDRKKRKRGSGLTW